MNIERVKRLLKERENIRLEFIEGATFKTIVPVNAKGFEGAVEGVNYEIEWVKNKIEVVNSIIDKENGAIIKDLMNKIGKSKATLKRYLLILKTIDIVEIKGTTRNGRYFIKKDALIKLKKK